MLLVPRMDRGQCVFHTVKLPRILRGPGRIFCLESLAESGADRGGGWRDGRTKLTR